MSLRGDECKGVWVYGCMGIKAVFCLLNADKVVLDGVGKKGYNFLV